MKIYIQEHNMIQKNKEFVIRKRYFGFIIK